MLNDKERKKSVYLAPNWISSMRLWIMFCLPLGGCAGTIPVKQAEFGAYPVDYKEKVMRFIGYFLKDEDTARFNFESPVKIVQQRGPIYGGGVEFIGYVVPVSVNAKNDYGGYTGYKTWMCLIKNQKIEKCMQRDYENDRFITAFK